MKLLRTAVLGVVETVFPERCCLCGAEPADVPFAVPGVRIPGLRWWDRPHLCRACDAMIPAEGPTARPAAADLPPVWAAGVTTPELVRAVGAMKYHGVRGLAWPLARHLARALPEGLPPLGLVPVPLHRRRRRIRGFNQAGLLARLVGRMRGLEVEERVLVRTRATAQQARLAEDAARRDNLAGAFAWRGGPPARSVVLVDDIVTSGATAREAAEAVEAVRGSGGRVLGVLCLGVAAGDREGEGAGVGPGPGGAG